MLLLTSNVSHCSCSGRSGSTGATQAHPRDSLNDRGSNHSGELTIANLAEHDRHQTSVHATVNKRAETTATLDKAASSLGVNAFGLFEEERENAEGMTPMERFLAEKKTSTLAKVVVNGKEEIKDHDRDLISLDSSGHDS